MPHLIESATELVCAFATRVGMGDRDFVYFGIQFFSIGYPRFLAGFAWFSSESLRSLSTVRGVRMEKSVLFKTDQETTSTTV